MKSAAAIVAAALALSAIVMPAEPLPVAKPSGSSQGAQATLAKDFSRESGTRHKVSVFKARERREPFGLSSWPSRRPWDGV
jgi:hypothetical protein